jgi:hypothetical protein
MIPGAYSEEAYKGVLEEDLADELKDWRHCKETLFTVLIKILIHDVKSEGRASDARLVFNHIEPHDFNVNIGGVKLEGVSIRMWFKNEGQVTARVLVLATMPTLTDHILSASEEEDDFNRAVRDWFVKVSIDIDPGHDASFASPDFLTKQELAEFQAGGKYMYSF